MLAIPMSLLEQRHILCSFVEFTQLLMTWGQQNETIVERFENEANDHEVVRNAVNFIFFSVKS